MSAGEVMHTASTGGTKAGNDERYDLIPAGPLRELARHYGVGSRKYEARNWERGYDWHLSYAALNRHLWAFWGGEDIDAPTGTKHVIAVAWHALALAEFMETHPEFDDRPVGTIESGLISITDEELSPLIFDIGTPIFDWKLTRTTLPAGTEGLWESEYTGYVYWHLEGEWWVMSPGSTREDPWSPSAYRYGDVPEAEGPFTSYVAPQED